MSKTKTNTQAASAIQPGQDVPASPATLRDKMLAMKASATARISAVAFGVSGDAQERAQVQTDFGTFYASEHTRLLLTNIAQAEAMRDVVRALDAFDKPGAIAALRVLASGFDLSGHEPALVAALLDILENSGPAFTETLGHVAMHFKTRARERWDYRGDAATRCERVPDRHTVQPAPLSGRPYGQLLSDK